ncbi:MAG TPA: leucine-rich repeat protein [Candidatus Eubacterium faecipullorum]|uniref:Leucine-rich repeat protein n=1 Tax=Candidatus Eubacterium faecipullorum TaxID=2838571 RepID=A0A9D1UFY0_9FIRM|nr:leucine-rich repeat protein [Candidatus Eubacterium faecipullorum]
MKKTISLLVALTMIVTSLSIAFPVFADTGAEVDTVVDELSELYQEEAEDDKSIEDSAASRVIVKANIEPETYGSAEKINGTDDVYIYQYETASEAANALEYYDSLSFVEWAETDGIVESQSSSFSADETFSYGADMFGSKYAKQYLETIDAPEVNIALIDTGINFHKVDFQSTNRVIDSGINLSDTGEEGTAQADVGSLSTVYHGSHITSILLDNTASNVNIIGYKAMNRDGYGTLSAVATCVQQAVEDGADIINLSLNGIGEPPSLIKEAIQDAYKNGVICVVAAGNYNDDVSYYYPANMDEVFTVGAVDNGGNPCFLSNYGEELDFVAPGYQIEVYGNSSLDKPQYVNGTSFAAPFIAAASAVALSVHPDYSVEEIKQVLIDSCVTKNDLAYSSPYLRDVEIKDSSLSGFTFGNLGEKAESEDLYYGYGMPQMQKIVGMDEVCSAPEFSVSSGTYHEEFELSLSSDASAEIYYTTDGSYPTAERSELYTEPLTVSSTVSIRAVAYSDGKIKSVPSSAVYKMEYYADESDFTIDDRGYITGYTGEKNEIIVPEAINGTTVKGVAEYAFYDDFDPAEMEESQQAWDRSEHLLGIVLPNTVTEIEDYAFFSFILSYVSAPGLKVIGEAGLSTPLVYLNAPNIERIEDLGLNYSNLTELDLPKLTYAGYASFRENKYLAKVKMPSLNIVPDSAFNNCYRLEEVELDSAVELEDCAFERCWFLRNVYAPDVETMGDMGFTYCDNLREISLPNLIRMDGVYNFKWCSTLTKIDLPKLQNIPEQTFMYCYMLSDINMPKVEQIGYQAFYDTYSLGNIQFDSLKVLGDEVFVNSTASELYAPNLETMGNKVFASYSTWNDTYAQNTNLKIIYAPILKTLSDETLAYTSGLTELDLPNLKTIGENALYESGVNYLYAPELETAESLPVTDNAVVVVSDKLTNCTYVPQNTTLTIQGDKGSYGEKYAESNGLEFIDVNAMGGSIRVTDAGLRFGYSFYDTQKKEVEEYGFVYAAGEQDGNDLTVEQIDGESVLQLVAYNRLTHEDETTTFNLVFTDIPQASYDMEVTARAYVKIDGKYFYSDVTTRSFNQVANAVLADDEIDENTKDALRKLYQ